MPIEFVSAIGSSVCFLANLTKAFLFSPSVLANFRSVKSSWSPSNFVQLGVDTSGLGSGDGLSLSCDVDVVVSGVGLL